MYGMIFKTSVAFLLLFFVFSLSGCSITITEKMIVSPSKEIDQANLDALVNESGFEEKYIYYEDGTSIHSLDLRKSGSSVTVVVLHGNALNMTLQPWFGLLQALSDLPFNVIAIDYQGFGKSSGNANFTNMNRDTQLLMESIDDDESIVLYGLSLGSVMAMNVSLDPRVKGVILEGAVSNTADMIDFFRNKNGFGNFVSLNIGSNIQFNNESAAAQLDVPLLVIHGEEDRNIPHRMSEQILESYQGVKSEFVLVEGGGHCNTFHFSPKLFEESLLSFIKEIQMMN